MVGLAILIGSIALKFEWISVVGDLARVLLGNINRDRSDRAWFYRVTDTSDLAW